MDETEEFEELLKEGEKIFLSISCDLNRVSKKHIHNGVWFYRSEDHFKEICIVLALAKRLRDSL